MLFGVVRQKFGETMSKNITRGLAGIVAAMASIAMLFCVLPAQAASGAWNTLSDAEKKSSYGYFVWKSENASTQDERAAAKKAADVLLNAPKKTYTSIGAAKDSTSLENFQSAVEEVQRINDFRAAQTDEPCRTDLAAGKGHVCDDSNKRLQPLAVTDVLMAIAQSNVNYSKVSSNGHAKQYNVGENLHWAGYLTFFEQLAQWYGDEWKNCKTGQSVAACGWYWTEKPLYDADPNDPGAGHYDNLTNKIADYTYTGVAINSDADYGYAVSQVYSYPELDAWNGMTAPTYTVKDYLNSVNAYASSLKSITAVTNPADITVESGTVKPADKLPTTVSVTYDDQSTGTAAVTWNIPDDWNANRAQHTVTLTGVVAGTNKTATLKLTVKAATVTEVSANGDSAITTPSGTNPINKPPKTAAVTWSNGSKDANAGITWESNDTYKQRAPQPYQLTGTVAGTDKTVTATITVSPATVTGVDQPAKASISKGTNPTVPAAVTVHWSNGDRSNEAIDWDEGKNPNDADFNTLGSRIFTGVVQGQKVTWEVEVVAAKVSKAYNPAPVSTEAGVDPTAKLPSTVKADLDNGQKNQSVSVAWSTLPDTWKNYQGGTITLKGTVNGQPDKTVELTITVKHATIEDQTLAGISVPAGVNPTDKLPKTTTITWSHNTGSKTGVAIVWSAIDESKYASTGVFNAVGTVSVDGQNGTVTMPITVTDPVAVKAVVTKTEVRTIATHVPDLSSVKAVVTYSNGSVKTVDVDWPDDIDVSAAGDITVTGTVRGVTIDGKDATVGLIIKVEARTITAVTPSADTISVPTAKDTDPAPVVKGVATVAWNDGAKETRDVSLVLPSGWNHDIAKHTVTATGRTDGWAKDIPFTVTVEAAVVEGVKDPDDLSTPVKRVPTLPSTAQVAWSNGQTTSEKVSWNKPDESVYAQVTPEDRPIVVHGTVKGSPVSVRIHVVAATITGVNTPEGVSTDAGVNPPLPSTVTAHWSNGSISQTTVTWNTDGVDFSNRSGADKTVKVKGTVTGWAEGVEINVTVHSAVATNAVVDGITAITTDSGKDPSARFPKNAAISWSDGGADSSEAITWEKFTGYAKREGGLFTVNGTVKGKVVTLQVQVKPATPVKVENDAIVRIVQTGGKLDLPEQLDVVWSNGDKVATTVAWDSYDAKLLEKAGSFNVAGKVNPADGVEYTVIAKVTVSAKQTHADQNSAKQDTVKDGNNSKNKLINTGSNIMGAAVVAVVLIILAMIALIISKNKRIME